MFLFFFIPRTTMQNVTIPRDFFWSLNLISSSYRKRHLAKTNKKPPQIKEKKVDERTIHCPFKNKIMTQK